MTDVITQITGVILSLVTGVSSKHVGHHSNQASHTILYVINEVGLKGERMVVVGECLWFWEKIKLYQL